MIGDAVIKYNLCMQCNFTFGWKIPQPIISHGTCYAVSFSILLIVLHSLRNEYEFSTGNCERIQYDDGFFSSQYSVNIKSEENSSDDLRY